MDGGTWAGGFVPVKPSDVVLVNCPTPLTLTLQSSASIYDSSLTLQGPVTLIIKDVFYLLDELHWSSEAVIKVDNATLSVYGNTQVYSTGSSLFISGASIVHIAKLQVDYMQIIDSTFSGDVFDGSLDASGSRTKLLFTSLHSQKITLFGITHLGVKSLMLRETLTIVKCDHVAFDEIIMGSNTTLDYTPPPDSYSGYYMDTGNIKPPPLYPMGQRPKLIFRENSYFLVGDTAGPVDFVLGNNTLLYSDAYSEVGFWGLQQEPNSYAVLNVPNPTFCETLTFYGVVISTRMTVNASLTVISSGNEGVCVNPGACCAHGERLTMNRGGSFTCHGTIEQSVVTIYESTSITANRIMTNSLEAMGGTINANVQVYTERENIPAVRLTDKTLTINGDFSLTNGVLTEVFNKKDFTPPLLLVTGEIAFYNTPPLVLVNYNSAFSRTHGKLLLAKSLKNLIFVDSGRLEVSDDWGSIYFSVTIENGEIFITRATLELYQILLAVAVTIVSIFSLLTYYYRIWKKSLTFRTHEHELEPLAT
eukprot:Phypoly_transcript_06123.p1 GENE.Phypoly_transcript_06123~~Phypoly_transcript_06123.p1  ORF type:complete len:594 (+),score=97.82 Phypoly_transcript_06123:183-1784(+)